MLQPVVQGYVIEGKTNTVVIPDLVEVPLEPSPVHFDELTSGSEDGNSEINENFLIHSVLGELGTETNFARSTTAEELGNHRAVNAKFLARPLTMDVVNSVHHDSYADQDGFIRTAELARVGIFSGDWVCILWIEETYLTIVYHRLSSLLHIPLLQQGYCASTPRTRSLLCEFDYPKVVNILTSPGSRHPFSSHQYLSTI